MAASSRLGLALLLALVGGPASAWGDQALEHYKRGLDRFKAGDCTAARKDFEAAYALSRHPNNLYYLGECQRRVGELRASHESYRRFAESQQGERRAELVQKLEGLRWGTSCKLSVASAPGGATVSLDGKPLGVTPADGSALQVSIPGGQHTLRLVLADHQEATRPLDAEFGEPLSASFALGAASRPASAPVVRCPGCAAPIRCPALDRCDGRRNRLLLGAGIGAAILSAGGLALGIGLNVKHNEETEGAPHLATYRGLSILGYVLSAVLGAASATTLVLYYRELRRGSRCTLGLAPSFELDHSRLMLGGTGSF